MNADSLSPLLVIGIMTGNSMDAVDAVLTAFYPNGVMKDLVFHQLPYPNTLFLKLSHLRSHITEAQGDMDYIDKHYRWIHQDVTQNFDDVLDEYMQLVLKTVNSLIKKAIDSPLSTQYDIQHIDLIGFHGQTCVHCPPSLTAPHPCYSVQIGDGQWLANQTGIPTIYDFRSDDLMAGGEAAPLIPTHHRHMARALKKKQALPILFINAGNTSNISLLTYDHSKTLTTLGWDAGPFNHFPDTLVRQSTSLAFDHDGLMGKKGKINLDLLRELFNHAACNIHAANFITLPPPKSADPAWYQLDAFNKSVLSFKNKLRTAEYFAAYLTFYSLGLTPLSYILPNKVALFGGGWKNPLILKHFKGLMAGDFVNQPLLPEHQEYFNHFISRLNKNGPVTIELSDFYGFASEAMEARLVADMARCRMLALPYSYPALTGCRYPQRCGRIAYPNGNEHAITSTLQSWRSFGNQAQLSQTCFHETRWSRSAAGWEKNKKIAQSNFNEKEAPHPHVVSACGLMTKN